MFQASISNDFGIIVSTNAFTNSTLFCQSEDAQQAKHATGKYLQLCTTAMLEHLRFHPAGAISGLHLLPIYPSSGDGGFAPLTYQDVDPKFGTWDDVKALGAEYDLQMECMVNHISPASKEFQDYLSKGDKSEFRDMFIDWNKFWGGGFLLVSIC